MGKEFAIRRVCNIDATPEQVWDAVTRGSAGWLWPVDVEPRLGGTSSMGGVVTAWDPPRHFANRMEGEDGWFNSLEHVIEPGEGGGTTLRYVHSGIFVDDWDNQYDGAGLHTDFYLDALAKCAQYFTGRSAKYVSLEREVVAADPNAMRTLLGGLGLSPDVAAGDVAKVELPGPGTQEVIVDFASEHFLGLRTDDAMYRFFIRNKWQQPFGLSLHLFDDAISADESGKAWTGWLASTFA